MPDNQFNNNPAPDPSPVPPPPSNQNSVEIRTQSSDINSIKQTGGGAPAPEQFNLGEIKPSSPPIPPSLNSNEPVFNPNENPSPATPKKSSIDFKKIGIIVGTIILLGILAWIGYAYIYPLIFPATPPVVVNPNPTPTPPPPPPKTIITHTPFVSFSGPSLGSVLLSPSFNLSLTNTVRSSTTAAPKVLTEVLVNDSDGDQVSSADFLKVILPDLSSDLLSGTFVEDFTALVYFDDNLKASPGYVFKLKPDVSLLDAEERVKSIESSNSLSNLFTENPGSPTAPWKTGKVNNLNARYVTFNNGALDYFWAGDYFVIISSFPGAEAVEPLIGQ